MARRVAALRIEDRGVNAVLDRYCGPLIAGRARDGKRIRAAHNQRVGSAERKTSYTLEGRREAT